ncbi:MAG: VWA domain-containing protein [Acidobacteriota bacterium]|nr:VWA domain-containing protein [Acidobacteriota bacterium]
MAIRRGVFASLVLLLLMFPAGARPLAQPPAAPPSQPPSFRAGTQVVALYATVTDRDNRLVPNLTKDDFQVFDEGKRQRLTVFKNEVEPITVAVLLDTSASMTNNLDLLRNAAEQFLLRLLPADRGMVGAFNDKIQLSGPFTSSRDDLIAYLQDLDYGNPTRLYDAIDAGLDQLETVTGRRVILVFTDGDDTASRASFGSVLDRAEKDGVMIYAIGLESEYFDGVRRVRTKPDRRLGKLAEDTGGGYFELKKTSDLASTFTRVAEELHSQYVLGFSPAVLDGRLHKLDVKITRPGMTVRARKTYLATADAVSPSGR